jgi:hypothetical protein
MGKIFKASANESKQQLSARRRRLKWAATVLAAVLAALPLKMSTHCYIEGGGYYSGGCVHVVVPEARWATAYIYSDVITVWLAGALTCTVDADEFGNFVAHVPWTKVEASYIVVTRWPTPEGYQPGTDPNDVIVRRSQIRDLPDILPTAKQRPLRDSATANPTSNGAAATVVEEVNFLITNLNSYRSVMFTNGYYENGNVYVKSVLSSIHTAYYCRYQDNTCFAVCRNCAVRRHERGFLLERREVVVPWIEGTDYIIITLIGPSQDCIPRTNSSDRVIKREDIRGL